MIYPPLQSPLKQTERKMLTYILAWNQSGTKEQIVSWRGEITLANNTRYPLYLNAIESLAKRGWIADCDGYFHSIETTCSKCGEN